MTPTITSAGNAGVRINTASGNLYIDSFFRGAGSVGTAPLWSGAEITDASLILVTHGHWDHFDAGEVAAAWQASAKNKPLVVCPESSARLLAKRMPSESIISLEPELRHSGLAASQTAQAGAFTITAFRTTHSRDHNSYLIEGAGLRLFHDGDNERTQGLDHDRLGVLDALFISTWQGSGWASFIERVSPKRWFLIHLNDEELGQQERGEFLPGLCGHPPLPGRLTTLRPGASCELR